MAITCLSSSRTRLIRRHWLSSWSRFHITIIIYLSYKYLPPLRWNKMMVIFQTKSYENLFGWKMIYFSGIKYRFSCGPSPLVLMFAPWSHWQLRQLWCPYNFIHLHIVSIVTLIWVGWMYPIFFLLLRSALIILDVIQLISVNVSAIGPFHFHCRVTLYYCGS